MADDAERIEKPWRQMEEQHKQLESTWRQLEQGKQKEIKRLVQIEQAVDEARKQAKEIRTVFEQPFLVSSRRSARNKASLSAASFPRVVPHRRRSHPEKPFDAARSGIDCAKSVARGNKAVEKRYMSH